jgi:hypothetical protein
MIMGEIKDKPNICLFIYIYICFVLDNYKIIKTKQKKERIFFVKEEDNKYIKNILLS